MGTKNLILSFDMETDIGSYTNECRGMIEGSPEMLRVLREHDVPASFLFTGREAKNHPNIVEQCLAEGHEIGCHTMFHETVGQPVFAMPCDVRVLDSELKGRLELATDTIEKVAGVRPISFRAPRLSGSTQMVNTLQELGYLVDSSFPAFFHGRDFRPYRPSASDWSKAGDMGIMEIPVFYDADMAANAVGSRNCDQWPMLRLLSTEDFSDLCLRMFARAEDEAGDAYLCIYLHPWEFVEMPGTIHIDEGSITFKSILHENTGAVAVQALDRFIGRMQDEGVTFTTLRDFAQAGSQP